MRRTLLQIYVPLRLPVTTADIPHDEERGLVHRSSPVHPAVDWLKTSAIVAVVVAHSGQFGFVGLGARDRFVRVTLAAFHVPVFLLVSGYLHSTDVPMTMTVLWRRLRRILVPYFLASVIAMALGLESAAPMSELPLRLATGSALAIYYFVPVWVGCVLTGWLWSRQSTVSLALALAIVAAATWVRSFFAPSWVTFFWGLRDPFLEGWILFYLTGWCARRFQWVEWIAAHRWSGVLAVAVCIPWLVGIAYPLLRIPYSIGVAWLMVALVTQSAPAVVLWMGRETLPIFLWHSPIATALRSWTSSWPTALSVPFVAAAALSATAGGILVVQMVWRHIGSRSSSSLPGETSTRTASSPV